MRRILTFILVMMLATMSYGYCARNNWGNTDLYLLLSREIPYDLMYRGTGRGGVSTIVSQVSKLSSTNLAFSILKLRGATKTFTIADGETGQQVTLLKSEYDPRSLVLSFNTDNPNTAHTGFTSVTFSTAPGSYVTLQWVDATVGWIIVGSQGVTITY